MENQAEQIWHETLEALKENIDEETFDLWLKPLKAQTIENNVLKVKVPNKFFKEWLEKNQKEKLEQAGSKIYTKKLAIEFSPSSEILPPHKPVSIVPKPAPEEKPAVRFNPKYTFESFVVGPCNRFAQGATLAVARSPGKAYNPLFIYGNVGLGKTHLLQAIGNYIKDHSPRENQKILYVTCDQFTNDFVFAIQKNQMESFNLRYRTADVLLIDDIQFLKGRKETQESFFHTFNILYESHKQIVITSDSSPKEIPTLEERLCSRFEWGVIADLQPPDLETRIAILKKKAEGESLLVPEDTILFLADQIKTNIRELEGSLLRVVAYSSIHGLQLTVDLTKQVLGDLLNKPTEFPPTLEKIEKVVARHFQITVSDLKGKSRTHAVAFPRQIAMYLCRNLTNASTPAIGEEFGGRSHEAVRFADDKIKEKISADSVFSSLINKITREIKSK